MTDLMTRPTYPYAAGGDDDHVTPPPPAPPVGPSSSSGDRRWPRRIVGGAAVLALVAGGGAAGGMMADRYLLDRTPATTAAVPAVGTAVPAVGTAVPAAGTAVPAAATDSLAGVVRQVQPSMVTVMVDGGRSSSLGSGVVLSSDGLILTNNHVIDSDGAVSVRLSTGQTAPARVVGADAAHDLALVQASGLSGLTAATFGTDDGVRVGDTVVAFGAPLGLENTVTSGIVSALDRSLDTGGEKLTGLLQTDAAINEGNSGGALVDTSGHVVGINVAIATASEADSGSIGVGFAIPADTVTTVVDQLRSRLG